MEPDRDEDLRERSLEQLNSFLRGEISAVETYEHALSKVSDVTLREKLLALQQSHRARCEQLRQLIVAVGGEASLESGPWGAFANAFLRVTRNFGDRLMLMALCEGEEHGVRDYEQDLEELDPQNRERVARTMLPEQIRTRDLLLGIAKVDDS